MASSSSMRSLCAAAVAIALFVGVASAASAAVSPMAIGFEDLPWRFNASNVPLHVTGSIPSWVDGHLYRVGPVRYSLGPGKPSIAHWFNGLGMLHSFHVSDGQIQYTASYVPSTQYNSTVPGGDPISNNGPTSANTCVTVRKDAGHLLANTGASLSNEFLPDGTWQELPFQYGAPLQPVAETFAPSHSQTAPSGELFHYRVLFGQGGMQGYQLYTVGTDDGNATRVPLAFIKPNPAVGKPLYQHALSLTENYVVLIEMPCTFGNGWKNFEWIPEVGTLWHIVSRTSGKEVATLKGPAVFYMHTVNAYEVSTGDDTLPNILLDVVTYPDNSLLDALYVDTILNEPNTTAKACWGARLQRFTLSLSTPTAPVAAPATLSPVPMEFPTINYEAYNTRPYRYIYAVGMSSFEAEFMDYLMKVDASGNSPTLSWKKPGCYAGEPIFVAHPNATAEDDGVVLSLVLDTGSVSGASPHSFVLLLNATTFEELAEAPLWFHIPLGFHGRFF